MGKPAKIRRDSPPRHLFAEYQRRWPAPRGNGTRRRSVMPTYICQGRDSREAIQEKIIRGWGRWRSERPLPVLLDHRRYAHHISVNRGEAAGGQFWETRRARPTPYEARRIFN